MYYFESHKAHNRIAKEPNMGGGGDEDTSIQEQHKRAYCDNCKITDLQIKTKSRQVYLSTIDRFVCHNCHRGKMNNTQKKIE